MKKETIKVPESAETEANETTGAAKPAPSQAPTRRLLPVILAAIATISWAGAALYLSVGEGWNERPFLDLLPLVAGVTTPIAIFWLIALAFQRTDPLLERRLTAANNLHKATAPVEAAEKRLAALNQSLKNELKNIDAVAALAAERIDNLEGRFQTQISDLFSATADTEAKTTSIRDILSREREAFGSLSSDLETRFLTLEKTVLAIASKLEQAGHSISANANTASAKLDEAIQNYGDEADSLVSKIDKVRADMENQTGDLDASAFAMEQRLTAVNAALVSSMSAFSSEMNDLELKSGNLTQHMETQAYKLKDLAEAAALETATIEASLKSHIKEVKDGADKALEHTTGVSETVSARAAEMSNTIIAAVDKAKAMLEEAGSALTSHGNTAITASENVAAMTLDSLNKASEAFESRSDAIREALENNLSQAQDILNQTADTINEQSSFAVSEAQATAERALQHIRQLRAGIEDQMQELANVGGNAKRELMDHADELANKVEDATSKASLASAEFSKVRADMDEQHQAITSSLSQTRTKLARLEEDLLAQQEVLVAASEASADSVIKAAERFSNRAQEIQDVGDKSADILAQKSKTIAEAMQQIGEAGFEADNKIASSIESLSLNANLVRDELFNSSNSIINAADAFAGERERINVENEVSVARLNQAANTIRENIDDFLGASSSVADKLESASQSLIDQTDRAKQDLGDAARSTTDDLAATLNDITDKAGEKLAYLREEMQATLKEALAEYQENAELAEKESSFLSMRLGKEATRINESVEQFLEKSREIETRISSDTKNEFARTSSLLMESLQSSSIDIDKALSNDIPDSAWSAYTNGDRSVFMRRALRFGDRKSRRTIANKFKSDSEFRDTVVRYFRDFESMMERAMIGDKGSVMSVTLLSSDMGKLYVMLAQSLKKFS